MNKKSLHIIVLYCMQVIMKENSKSNFLTSLFALALPIIVGVLGSRISGMGQVPSFPIPINHHWFHQVRYFLLFVIIFTNIVFRRIHRFAGYLLVLYLIWVAFSLYLNLGFCILN